MLKRLIRRLLWQLLLNGPDIPMVKVATEHPVEPSSEPQDDEPQSLDLTHPGGRIAIPKAKVTAREGQISKLLEEGHIVPDVTTILALRRVHDRLVRFNVESHYLLDQKPSGSAH